MGNTHTGKDKTMTTTTRNLILTAEQIQKADRNIAAENAKHLARWIKRHDKWMSLCDDLSDARETYGENSPEVATAYAAWQKGLKRRPSKDSKHDAYSAARRVARWINANGFHTIEFHTSVDDLRDTLAAARHAGLMEVK